MKKKDEIEECFENGMRIWLSVCVCLKANDERKEKSESTTRDS